MDYFSIDFNDINYNTFLDSQSTPTTTADDFNDINYNTFLDSQSTPTTTADDFNIQNFVDDSINVINSNNNDNNDNNVNPLDSQAKPPPSTTTTTTTTTTTIVEKIGQPCATGQLGAHSASKPLKHPKASKHLKTSQPSQRCPSTPNQLLLVNQIDNNVNPLDSHAKPPPTTTIASEKIGQPPAGATGQLSALFVWKASGHPRASKRLETLQQVNPPPQHVVTNNNIYNTDDTQQVPPHNEHALDQSYSPSAAFFALNEPYSPPRSPVSPPSIPTNSSPHHPSQQTPVTPQFINPLLTQSLSFPYHPPPPPPSTYLQQSPPSQSSPDGQQQLPGTPSNLLPTRSPQSGESQQSQVDAMAFAPPSPFNHNVNTQHQSGGGGGWTLSVGKRKRSLNDLNNNNNNNNNNNSGVHLPSSPLTPYSLVPSSPSPSQQQRGQKSIVPHHLHQSPTTLTLSYKVISHSSYIQIKVEITNRPDILDGQQQLAKLSLFMNDLSGQPVSVQSKILKKDFSTYYFKIGIPEVQVKELGAQLFVGDMELAGVCKQVNERMVPSPNVSIPRLYIDGYDFKDDKGRTNKYVLVLDPPAHVSSIMAFDKDEVVVVSIEYPRPPGLVPEDDNVTRKHIGIDRDGTLISRVDFCAKPRGLRFEVTTTDKQVFHVPSASRI
ncbi:hypothetical protein DFA_05805 [Cavenderia fasciculata]|uniref:Uncharacterized protein n=1 Tax=Cavenderia fasciculata TaxID=261658 RepID=F4PMS7_CACFS|nr:uncharacterized protein DFA_05805 [Cavenderia fasciculata]EGG23671.1 hypothetical protein DFA_05805 [Cavenderia fasciculata]|eukprot:XP_004361522.1 hypothetical protein DFA_05805 [Cavenderia fasciculata]